MTGESGRKAYVGIVPEMTGYLCLVLVCLTAIIAVARYAFSWGEVWMQEIVLWIFAAIILLTPSSSILQDRLIRVDVIHRHLTQRGKRFVDIVGLLMFQIPVSVMMVAVSIPYVRESWKVMEHSRDPGGLPATYLLKSLIPLGFAAMCLAQILWLLMLMKAWQRERSMSTQAS